MRLFDLNATASTPGVLTFQAPQSQKKNFAPRVGFAYSPGNNAKTSIRGGFGMAYDQVFDNVGTNATPPQASATVNSDGLELPQRRLPFERRDLCPTRCPRSLNPAQARAASSSLPAGCQNRDMPSTWNLSYPARFREGLTR